MLEIKPGPSARAVSAPNCGTISPAFKEIWDQPVTKYSQEKKKKKKRGYKAGDSNPDTEESMQENLAVLFMLPNRNRISCLLLMVDSQLFSNSLCDRQFNLKCAPALAHGWSSQLVVLRL